MPKKPEPPAPPSISEALLAAIHGSDLTPYAIAKSAGVAMTTVYRFIDGSRWPSLDAVDKLARFFGLALAKK